ncbi:sensor histidine kinase [Streptomyces sp. NPDC058579]|uniref:sensor histidine kinase n=1 Tax=Streptomyces sp. NPDC058579 TaxID=3346548 RepID=UPI00366100BB
MNEPLDAPPARGRRRPTTALLCVGLLLPWCFDLVAGRPWWPWPLLLCGPLVAAVVLVPGRPALPARSGAAVLLSGGLTAFFLLGDGVRSGTWGFAESIALLVLLTRAARGIERAPVALGTGVLLGVTAAAAPLRLGFNDDTETLAVVLAFVAAGCAGLGAYLRALDTRRAHAVASVRDAERLRLARDLHDFVAHHVTGIVLQARAAQAVKDVAPEQVDAILTDIERAGTETLDSMRRLVRILREESGPPREDDLSVALGALVAGFGDGSTGLPAARLEIAAPARVARLAPEVATSVHRVVQEALTNTLRHSPDTDGIRIQVTADDRTLDVEVVNGPGRAGGRSGRGPTGGRGGFGLIGLRERVEAVGGELETGPLPGGGWRVAASLPVLGAQAARPLEGSTA